MSSNPASHVDLIEPLREFLESFTQELTEQKFVPAFRDELKRLLGALESVQQSEETLQEIARGVENLREVFTPAGARLLESAKDLEQAMRSNADQIKGRAEDVLRDLLQTHEQLETALRSEAGLMQEQTSAGREALARTVEDIEGRLSGLTSHLETLCQRISSETSAAGFAVPASPPPVVSAPTVAGPIEVNVEIPDDLRNLISRTEQAVSERLEEQRDVIASLMTQVKSEESQRLQKLDQRVTEALESVGPRLQEELDSAVSRLRDQIQTLILAEMETRTMRPAEGGESSGPVPSAEFSAALTASETRILRELSALQKSSKGEQSEAERLLKELARGLEDASERYVKRAEADSQTVKDSLSALQRLVAQLKESSQQDREQYATVAANLDALVKGHREYRQMAESEFTTTRNRLEAQARALELKTEDDRRVLTDLSAAVSRTEQAATKAIDLAMTDGRVQRDRIEAGLKDLRDRLDRSANAEQDYLQDIMRQVAESWTEALEALRDFVQKTVAGRTDSIISRIEGMDARLAEAGQSGSNLQRDIQSELKRMGSLFDERLDGLKNTSESFTTAMESHVKAVSGEVAALRAKQDQSLAVLKEAIRANYDDNAARLREVVESAYDNFVNQTTNIPQVIDRFTNLMQSQHQGTTLALQTISSDTRNVLNLANEKFEVIVSDNTAMKKFFPLLDKKLEKHSAELDMVRKAQVRQDKELSDLPQTLNFLKDWHEEQNRDLRTELKRMQEETEERLEFTKDELREIKAEQASLQNEDLPNFRREVSSLVTSKLEFIENTLHERQESLQKEINEALERGQAANKKTFMIVAALVGLSIVLQLIFHFATKPGVGG
ncbi:MAG: hypothetical protein ACOZB3_04575 [Calditrichota bacterium]